jgi:hypothetical protein
MEASPAQHNERGLFPSQNEPFGRVAVTDSDNVATEWTSIGAFYRRTCGECSGAFIFLLRHRRYIISALLPKFCSCSIIY